MYQIRNSVFETNSSSTHSLTFCKDSDYQKWIRGELLFHEFDEKFYTREEALKYITNRERERDPDFSIEYCEDDLLYDYRFQTHKEWYDERRCNSVELSFYTERYVTEHGDNIVAFGYYGRD